jgi:hypothetical protein
MIDLVPVTRPNGKVYRPRKQPHAEACKDNYYGEPGVIVVGTHDVDRAERLANAVGGLDEPAFLYPRKREWRRDGMHCGQREWVFDEEHGVPCVVFGAWVSPDSSWAV